MCRSQWQRSEALAGSTFVIAHVHPVEPLVIAVSRLQDFWTAPRLALRIQIGHSRRVRGQPVNMKVDCRRRHDHFTRYHPRTRRVARESFGCLEPKSKKVKLEGTTTEVHMPSHASPPPLLLLLLPDTSYSIAHNHTTTPLVQIGAKTRRTTHYCPRHIPTRNTTLTRQRHLLSVELPPTR